MTETTPYKAFRNRWLWIAGCIEVLIYISFGRVFHAADGSYYDRPQWVHWVRDTIGEPSLVYWFICLIAILALRIVMIYRIVSKSPKKVKYGAKYGWLSMQLAFSMIGILIMGVFSEEKELVEYYWLFIMVMIPFYAVTNLLIAIVGCLRHRVKIQSDILDMAAE